MRRTLVLLLLAFLPLHFSWAAVATYCEHESQSGAAHLGHHEHQHTGAHGNDADAGGLAQPDGAGGKAAGAADLDCGHCQGHCVALPALPSGPASGLSTALPRAGADAAQGTLASARPERPQWARLA